VRAIAAILLLAAVPAYAGIVITKNGKSFIGRIDEGDVSSRTIVLRQPNGRITFDRSDVRWFDERSDEPTDAYFKQFLDEPLDPKWAPFADAYRKWLKIKQDGVTGVTTPPRLVALPSSRVYGGCEVLIRQPSGWSLLETGERILMFESPDQRARIHVFASDLAGEKALTVAHAALEKIGTRFESATETPRSREWLTAFEHGGKSVRAVRRIIQTERSTAFAVAYCSGGDFDALAALVRESLDTFQAHEK